MRILQNNRITITSSAAGTYENLTFSGVKNIIKPTKTSDITLKISVKTAEKPRKKPRGKPFAKGNNANPNGRPHCMNVSIKNADKKRMPRGKPFKKGEVHNPR